ncbi:MAG: hypothetical protein HOU01_19625 [Streptomycetaceae bacterium]|nr:hypothetical protein [Streptomycetaceae bacterium]
MTSAGTPSTVVVPFEELVFPSAEIATQACVSSRAPFLSVPMPASVTVRLCLVCAAAASAISFGSMSARLFASSPHADTNATVASAHPATTPRAARP